MIFTSEEELTRLTPVLLPLLVLLVVVLVLLVRLTADEDDFNFRLGIFAGGGTRRPAPTFPTVCSPCLGTTTEIMRGKVQV